MSGPTPEQQKEIDRMVDLFDQDWEAVIIPHPEIRRKRRSIWGCMQDWVKPRKHTVFALYWWHKRQYLKDKNLQKLKPPLQHDNMPIPGHPVKYEMRGDWRIRQKDLKFLKAGPLVSKGLGEVLVPYDRGWDKFRRIISENRIFFGVVVFLVGIFIDIWIEITF